MNKLFRFVACVIALIAITANEQAMATPDYDYDYVYSNGYDGYVNIRQKASTKSSILGIMPNGNNAAEFIEVAYDNDKWYYIYYNGIYGYVAKSQMSWKPTAAVNLDIKASWIEGKWVDDKDNVVTLDRSGNFYYKGDMEAVGKWRLSGGNNISLKATYIDWSRTFTVDLNNNVIGPYYRLGSEEQKRALALKAAVNVSNLTESDLNRTLYASKDGILPTEYAWLAGEWRSTAERSDLAIIGQSKAYIHTAEQGTLPLDLSTISAERYAIGYKFSIANNCWYMAITAENMPTIYINNELKQLFVEANGEHHVLSHVSDSTANVDKGKELDTTTIIIIGGAVLLLAAIVAIVVLLRKLKAKNA
ncbi:MAG: SH3 domain-containing protein [Alistipes sp.]|nr:SH3 domain-containing protein [Alistipes sp.]